MKGEEKEKDNNNSKQLTRKRNVHKTAQSAVYGRVVVVLRDSNPWTAGQMRETARNWPCGIMFSEGREEGRTEG